MQISYEMDVAVVTAIFLLSLYLYIWLQFSKEERTILLYRNLVLLALVTEIFDIGFALSLKYSILCRWNIPSILLTLHLVSVLSLGIGFVHFAEFYVRGLVEVKRTLWILMHFFSACVVFLLGNLSNHTLFEITKAGVCRKGPLYFLIYLIPFCFFLWGTGIMLRGYEKLTVRQRIVVILFLVGGYLSPALEYFVWPKKQIDMLTPSLGLFFIFSQIQNYELQLMSVDYRLSDIIEESMGYMQWRIHTRAMRVGIRLINNPNIPCVLFGDATRIRQILVEMLILVGETVEDGYVNISVSGRKGQNGELLLQIIMEGGRKEPRVRNLDKRTIRLVELMNGVMQVESGAGKRLRLMFQVPQIVRGQECMGVLYEKDVLPILHGVSKHLRFRVSNTKLLIVDDLTLNCQMIRDMLKFTGAVVEEAVSGEQFLEKITKETYDLILLDEMLPGIKGAEAFQLMRKGPTANRKTPVIVMTAGFLLGSKDDYIKQGFAGFLPKPFSEECLGNLLRNILPDEKFEDILRE